MLQFFRNFFQSKIGVGVTLGIVAIIGVAFALGDVSSSSNFGGIAGGDRVASVGHKRIDSSALSSAISNAVDSMRERNPQATVPAFIKSGGLEDVLEELIDRTAMAAFGEKHGVIAGDRLIDSEIAKIAAFRGPDGKFSESAYRSLLAQRGVSEKQLREDIAQSLIARQMLTPAEYAGTMPREAVSRYATIITERRSGAIALLPSAAFAPKTVPTDAELASFYKVNNSKFIRPERRVIRFATFDESAVKTVAPPTEAEIAARYAANKDQYAASESRRITQLILPTEAGAKAVLAELTGGKSIEAAASAKGLSAGSLGVLSKQQLSGMSSAAVADATFAGERGKIVGPVKSGLGWHLMRVDEVQGKAARTLEQVRGELTTAVAAEKRRTALTDFSAGIEDEFDGGGTLSDVAKQLGLTLSQAGPVVADGRIYGKQNETAPAVLAKVLQAAFAMEGENQAQLAEIEPGKTFIIFDVSDITPMAAAPLAEIKNDVVMEWQLAKGAELAKAAAIKVEAQVRKGVDLGAALASLGVPLPPVDRVDMARQQLAQMRPVPAPLQLLFNMAEGTAKSFAGPRNRGWYVVALKDIVPGTIPANDPRIAGFQRELARVAGAEFGDQLRTAIRKDLEIKRNETAISAVRRSLSGTN